MDATCAAEGGDTSANMIEIIQNPDVTRRMAHARHARSRSMRVIVKGALRAR
jgi:hypothetical protein